MSIQEPSTETPWQRERRLFRELSDRLVNAWLNWFFDLGPERAQSRMRNLTIGLIVAIFFVALIYYRPSVWAANLQDLFLYLLNADYAVAHPNSLNNFINFLEQVVIDPRILQYIPILIAPFFIAQQLAAYYLADIFELEDMTVARSFVSEVALSGSDETIRISEGRIADKYLQSPNYQIGGPGKVIVDLDSVALFEKADGTPHVIGPTGREPGGRATIDGFERFRQAIDIRDQYVDISVTSRSRDGIPISATDVRLMFSIDRGENPQPSAEFPYPFSKSAIEKIVYKSSSRVTPDQKEPSAYEFSWIGNMLGLIRGRLGGFMGSKNLTEYLANIGQPELEKAKQQEELIAQEVRKLAQPDEDAKAKEIKLPAFTPRNQITNLFSQFTNDFIRGARNSGVELHWIGVGTWKTPPDIDVVSEKHVEAWKLSQENMRAGSNDAMKGVEGSAMLKKMEDLIRSVPFEAYYDIIGMKKTFGKQWGNKKASKKQDTRPRDKTGSDDVMFDENELVKILSGGDVSISDLTKRFNDKVEASAEKMFRETDRESDRRGEMRELLMEYRNQLIEAVQFMNAKGEPVPQVIEEAIKHINQQMGFRHFVGRP